MTGHRVLIVDDEPQILRFLKPSLVAAGYEVVAAATGGEALKAAATRAPDVIVLDLGLPDMDGKDVIRELRTWCKTPILVLSARDREAEKIAALDLGADDYINKPFGIGELTARLRTALRHAAQASGEQSRFQSGALEIDVLAHTVTWAGVPLKLTLAISRVDGNQCAHHRVAHPGRGPELPADRRRRDQRFASVLDRHRTASRLGRAGGEVPPSLRIGRL